MKQTSDELAPLQELIERVTRLLECDGITQVTQSHGVIQALVDDNLPILVNFVPNQQTKEDEYVLQIYFTLSALRTTNLPLLSAHLDELTPHLTLGKLCILPGREIGYYHHLPIKISAVPQAETNFKLSFQLMLLFLFEFLPYVQRLSEDPESITLPLYLAEEE